MKRFLTTLMAALPLWMAAQNMTDRAVMNDRSAAQHLVQNDRPAVADTAFLHPDRIRFDHRCVQIEGRDLFLLGGTIHYFRVPEPLWRDRLLKLRRMGCNMVETYVPWNWHERQMPASVDDYSKVDLGALERFLCQAEQLGFYVMVRPGPYICAEWSGGGFPQWLMQKRPRTTTPEVWLQSDEPAFVEWCKHWYRAVARVVEPHQLQHRRPVEGGVIFWQLENEYNRVKWVSAAGKRHYLEQLANASRQDGIEVPFITCWTGETRRVEQGPLHGMVDMVNSYPRWQIEKGFGRLINQQLKSMPGKPLISGELQGGWYSDVGGKLSHEQEGVAAVQTQNITLYALQRGFCALNFYMMVGGTNLDDWASRGVTTTYDFAAAIGEDGAVNERYYRLQSLAPLLHEHGTRIARAREVADLAYTSTDPDVKLALRRAANGDRYYFVRTEEHSRHHSGTLQTADLALDFALEPFGSMVYYLPAGAAQGRWYPQPMQPQARPAVVADTIALQADSRFADPLPQQWKKLGRGETIDRRGIYGRHFIYYRTFAPEGRCIEVERIGSKVVNGSEADTVLVMAGGRLLPIAAETAEYAAYRLPGDSVRGRRMEVTLLYESKGLHHHTNRAVEEHWGIGPRYVRCGGRELPLAYAYTEQERGTLLSAGKQKTPTAQADGNPLLAWHTFSFSLPARPAESTYPYHLHLEHTGNGFIYLNGHCLGRCWQQGPQRDYYLPECWLNFGGENRLAISLRPTADGAEIRKAEMVPVIWAAEYRTDQAEMAGLWGDQGDGTFRNPVIAADYSDPDVLRVGDDYYMVASTFESFPGVSILHSRDLVNWRSVGAALTDLESISPAFGSRQMERYNGGVYAPTISYHNGKYYIYVNLYTDGFIVATADHPQGSWQSRFLKDKQGRPLRVTRWTDPCPFWDEDGQAYLAASHPGRKYWYSYLFRMSEDGTMLLDADSLHMSAHDTRYTWPDGGTLVSPYHSSEGNRIFKRNGYYYLQHIEFTNDGQGAGTYIFRSRHIYGTHPDGTPGTPGHPGEYEKRALDRVDSQGAQRIPGQGGYVTTPDGRWWWMGQFNRNYPYGRPPHLLPVRWVDDWPVIGDGGKNGEGQMVWSLTKPIQGVERTLPQGSDDFSAPGLAAQWSWNHQPQPGRWSLTARPGFMRLYAAPTTEGKGFFKAAGTLHQRHLHSRRTEATVRMDLEGMAEGQLAGLAHFDGGKHYAAIGVVMDGQGKHLCHETDGVRTVGERLSGNSLYLRTVTGEDDVAAFYYSTDGLHFTDTGLRHRLAFGNFRGDRVGLFTCNETAERGYVDVDWFRYSTNNQ